jgi:hypothetical protein
VTGQVRSLFDRILQSQLTNHVNSLIIRKAISLDLQFFEDPIFTTPCRTRAARRTPAR